MGSEREQQFCLRWHNYQNCLLATLPQLLDGDDLTLKNYMMGSEREQQFCLRWHNYQNCLLATLPQLLDGDDLTDVTLCAGGRNIKAHKVVLSACSQYFKDLFKEMIPIQHPVIVLPGTYFSDLVALVTFMYSGEVNIFEHQLAGLLSVAETLQIRGLAEFTWSGNPTNNNEAVKKEILGSPRCKRAKTAATVAVSASAGVEEITVSPPLPSIPRPRQKAGEQRGEDSGWGEGGPAGDQHTAEDLSNRATVVADGTDNNQSDSPQLSMDLASNPADLTQAVIETKTRNSSCNPKMYATCFVCGKQLSNQYNLRVHMETHQNAHYACASCSHVSRSRDALRKHVSYRHPQTTAGLQPPSTPRSTHP